MIVTQFYELAGQSGGMPVIQETGIAVDDEATITLLRKFECGRVEIIPIPRAQGLVAKSLDGMTISEETIMTAFGKFEHCIQQGRTVLRDYAPRQPFGAFQGKRLLAYVRTWLQLEE